ncbi:MAG: nucleoside triphosphate pyrophosphohydrolase [Treponema sp.]|jgi:tetrapyrrole methylase family protein/MazG family protein|nr:nucleoside triphosphate pyrophosphohydrolase [Treponema sp.]
MTAGEAFKGLYDVVVKLRGPEGCPWDREQNPASLRGALIEETYECVEAINEKNSAHIAEELGDIFLLATMLSYMHEETGAFTVADALKYITEKLIRRHPHVFAGMQVKDSAEVLNNWANIKVEKEGRKPKDSLLDEVSAGLPPMDRAYSLQKKAAKAGFDWPDREGVAAKIKEELEEALDASDENREEELGDLLFSVVNLCRYCKVDPSTALHGANVKFVKRFKHVEKRMKETGQEMKSGNLAVMDSFWNEAKEI